MSKCYVNLEHMRSVGSDPSILTAHVHIICQRDDPLCFSVDKAMHSCSCTNIVSAYIHCFSCQYTTDLATKFQTFELRKRCTFVNCTSFLTMSRKCRTDGIISELILSWKTLGVKVKWHWLIVMTIVETVHVLFVCSDVDNRLQKVKFHDSSFNW